MTSLAKLSASRSKGTSAANKSKSTVVAPPAPPKVAEEEVVSEEQVEEPVEEPATEQVEGEEEEVQPSPLAKTSRRKAADIIEPEEAEAVLEEEEEPLAAKLTTYKGIPAIPSHEEVTNNLEAWQAYLQELVRIVGDVEEVSEVSGSGSDVGSEGSEESEMEEEEPGEEEEKEMYVGETLEERKARATAPLNWQCYEIEVPRGQKTSTIGDVLCCMGDQCHYTQKPELLELEKPKRGKAHYIKNPDTDEWILVGSKPYNDLKAELAKKKSKYLDTAPIAEPYKESFRLTGTDVYLCDRCYTDAKRDILEAAEKARLGVEEDEKGISTKPKSKKGKGKKGEEEEEKEIPLVLHAGTEEAIEEEYKRLGLPREPVIKVTKKKKNEEEEESDESSDIPRAKDVVLSDEEEEEEEEDEE